MPHFGKYLQGLRKERGLSQKRLASLSEISSSYLSRVERGQRNIPHPTILKRLAEALGISAYNILAAAGIVEEQKDYAEGRIPEYWHSLIADPNLDELLQQLGSLTEQEKKSLSFYLQAIKINRNDENR